MSERPLSRSRFAVRRSLVLGAGTLVLAPGMVMTWPQTGTGEQVYKDIHQLKPGEYTWHPERAPQGSVVIVVSLTDQLVHVYRNGIRIAVSTCSTGKKGHRTPTGVFTILQKDKHHHSSTYNNAPMPNMNRLTWSGIALHAGRLPGYPASHGCIRLPLKFSARLFKVTHVGTPVILASAHHDPVEVVHPGMVLSRYAADEFDEVVAKLRAKKHPHTSREQNQTAVTSVLVSRADEKIFILIDGEIVIQGKAFIKNIDQPLGSHVFVLNRPHDGRRGLAWHAVGHHPEKTSGFARSEESVIKRIGAEKSVIDAMKANMHPGLVMVLTDLPAHPDTRTGRDFVIMTEQAKS